MRLSKGEETFAQHLKAYKIPFEREVKFHPKRKWRFDFLLPNKIAIECEGGTWSGGRHTRGKAFQEDCLKYGEAAILGYRVMRFTTDQITSGVAIEMAKRAIEDV